MKQVTKKILMGVKEKFYLKSMLVIIFMMFIINNSISANSSRKDASKDSLSSSVGIWHPKMFYIVLPDLSLSFILPYEPDQSGFYNMFFISKESGETLLLDSIEDNIRHFTPFSSGSCYDVVVLYNNGKYVKHNDIIFENDAELDMSNQQIQRSNSVSEQWKTMRAFTDTINGRASGRDDMPMSDYIIKGYVLSATRAFQQEQLWEGNPPFFKILSGESEESIVKNENCSYDGYFKIDVEDESEQIFRFHGLTHVDKEINMTAPCGLFLLMRGFGKASKTSQ